MELFGTFYYHLLSFNFYHNNDNHILLQINIIIAFKINVILIMELFGTFFVILSYHFKNQYFILFFIVTKNMKFKL
mgnify:CR=1 FL=1